MNQRFHCSCLYDSLNITWQFCFIYRQSALEVPESQLDSSQSKSAGTSAEPQKEDIEKESLQQQKNQSAALEHGLQSIAQKMRAVSSVALRWDTRAIVVHTRQLVSAISGLTMAVNVLTRGIEDEIQAVGRTFCSSGPSTEQLEMERGERRRR